MSLHRAVLIQKGLHGVPDLVKDHVPLGGSYVVDMARRTKAKLVNGHDVEMVWVRSVDGAEGTAPMALYEIEEGEME